MLTEQRRKYAESRVKGYSKREAAIAAGCPPKTATQAAARLEKNPDVLMAIAAINGGQPLELHVPTPKRAAPTTVAELPTSLPALPEAADDPLPKTKDPIEFLQAVMTCERVPINERNKAAIKLAELEARKKPEEAAKTVNKFRKATLKAVG